jgi:acyl-CoA synthetase (AMP-forming)/AMP-acid ligase II
MFNSLCFDIHKHKIFIKNKNLSLTYGEVFKLSTSWAKYFKDHALDDTIALSMPNCLEAHILLFAAMQSHNVTLINPTLLQLSPDLLDRLNVTTLVSFTVSDVAVNQITLDRSDIVKLCAEEQPSDMLHSLTLLSSGTTGEVKPVVLQATEIEQYGSLLKEYFLLDSDDCLYNVLPYYHGFGLTRMFTAMNSGSAYYIPDEPDYRNIVSDIDKYRCTWISLVPNMARVMIKNSGALPENFKFATVSADICSRQLIESFKQRFGVELFSEYGCTEASIISSNTWEHNKAGSVGKIDAAKVKIINNEIYATTQWKNQSDWVNTGDIGSIDADGFLFIQGRTKEIIKRQGKTIFPYELEKNLEAVTGVDEAVVYCNGTDNKGDCIGLAYAGTAEVEEVKSYCLTNLPADYRPKTITRLKTIPRVGPKVRRREMREYVNKLQ